MPGVVMNGSAFSSGLDGMAIRVRKKFQLRIYRIMHFAMTKLLARTPVNTGRAVSNYVASTGTAYSGVVHPGVAPVEATNPLPLGAERLRGQAEAISRATLANVNLANPYQAFYITNNAPNISGLEHGELPMEPYRQRSPNGMFRITLMDISAAIRTGKL